MSRHLPLSQVSSTQDLTNIRLVATDMDGTLTTEGKFTATLLQALEDLTAHGIKVLIVTGRSAGWVSGLVSYLPVAGAIAENGSLFYLCGNERPVALTPIPDLVLHRQQLAKAFLQLQSQFPHIQESADNRFRITDWTFDVDSVNTDEIQTISHLCQQIGWGFTYSNVQCHIKPLGQDKGIGLLQVLRDYFPQYTPGEIVTVGDSPNDESLFDELCFPISVGVANIREYTDRLQHQPVYVTTKSEGQGFCELAQFLLQGSAAS
ncbi:MAG: HAD family hydrolase [Rhizonema sp. PD38]|nr:HAD family hydrolase [Rhizonema sp. PD38]